MKVFVNIGLWLYFQGIWILSPFHAKARKMINGRRGIFNKLREEFPSDKTVIWFHASSLGEFEQGRPIIDSWKSRYPDDFILLTFYSPSGYELKKDYKNADYICYLPFDKPIQIRKFIRIINPKVLILIKYEFWPNLLLRMKKLNIPVYLVSALFRPQQHFFKWYGCYFRRLLNVFSQIFVQNEVSRELLAGIGINDVQISGDTRIDRVNEVSERNESIPGLDEFTQDSFVLIGGSTWEPEEEMMSEFSSNNNIKLILAPHNIQEEHLRSIEDRFEKRIIRYSNWINNRPFRSDFAVLLIDQIGLLSRLYKYADLAFIGGGFGRGLHNLIEPAAFGIPMIFGPNFKKFPEAMELQKYGGGFAISSYDEFAEITLKFLNDKFFLSNAGGASRRYVDNFKGATDLITSWLMENVQH